MKERFIEFGEKHGLFRHGITTYLAVSGGLDSVAMAHLFKAANLPFEILHCNFQLRGNESEDDQKFVEELAETLGVDCQVRHFDTETYSQTEGLSIQEAARNLRYAWFREVIDNNKDSRLATAHQKNDVAETMIFNLAKGTGLAGLHSIPVITDNSIIRPMLFATRDEIAHYATKQKLSWREDSSNLSEKYSRNQVRLNVIPELQRINPALVETLANSAKIFRQAELIVSDWANSVSQDCSFWKDDSYWISRAKVAQTMAPEYLLYELLKPFGFNADQVQNILKTSQTGAVFQTLTYQLNVDREFFIVSPFDVEEINVRIDLKDETTLVNNCQFQFSTLNEFNLKLATTDNVFLDFDKLQFPLTLRTWRQGDRFRPLGMSGQKMVSDLLIDNKVPVNLKRKTLVLTSDDEIVWVVGYQISDRFKVDPDTRQVYRIVMEFI